MPPFEPVYPAQLQIERQPEYDGAKALLRCWETFLLSIASVLAILPQIIVLFVLEIGAFFGYLGVCVAVLVTARYPRGLFDFIVGVIRWASRVSSWTYNLTDSYPPFSFDPDAHPLRFDAEYPEGGVSRWRGIPLLTGIMALPILIVGWVLLLVGYLVLILPPIIPGVASLIILFTGQYPESLFNLVRNGLRLTARGQAYATFTVTKYPPFDI
jgi:hypothetical protein